MAGVKTTGTWLALLLTPVFAATLFLVILAAIPYANAIQFLPAWTVVVPTGVFVSVICVRIARHHKLALWVVAISLCTMVTTLFSYFIFTFIYNSEEEVLSSWAIWIAAPYLGHCCLAIVFRRDNENSPLILVGTLFSACIAAIFHCLYLTSVILDRHHGAVEFEDLRPLLLFGAMPLLQWAFLVFLALVALAKRLMRRHKRDGIREF